MKRTLFTHVVAVASLAAAFSIYPDSDASAQTRWGRPTLPRAGACFYRDVDFGGDYFCVQAGRDIQDIPNGMNDQISSIRTVGPVDVTVFQNQEFRGRSARFSGDVRDLRRQGWNDRLSSVRIDADLAGGGGVGNSNDRQVLGNREATRVVERAYRDILGRQPDPEGMREYRDRLLYDNWTEDQVRQALRRSQENREQNRGWRRGDSSNGNANRARAEQVVRQAYLNVLRREPDSGSQTFVERVLNDGWDLAAVERALRNSDEFRNKVRARPR